MHLSKNLCHRLVLGSSFAALAATLVTLSQYPLGFWVFASGMIAIQVVALTEFVYLCRTKGFAPAAALLYATSILAVGSHAVAIRLPQLWWLSPAILLASAILSPACTKPSSMANLALTLFGTIYISLPFCWLFDITIIPHTPFWLTWLLIATKGSDVAAYVCGKFFGTHHLAPQLSPKKTIEGALGGILGAALLSVGVSMLWDQPPQLSLWTWIFIGALTGATAMGGDLFESLLKRDAGVKDSSTIPGLGGILDTIDSLLFTTPLLFIILTIMGQL